MTLSKVVFVSVVVAVIVSVGVFYALMPKAPAFPEKSVEGQPVGAGAVLTNVDQYVNGLQIGDLTFRSYEKQISLGSYQAVMLTNKTGRDFFVEWGEVQSFGTASSSVRVAIGYATTTTVNSYLNPGVNGTSASTSILLVPFATSSPATTTNSQFDSRNNKAAPARIPDGQSVLAYVLQGLSGIPSDACAATGASCDNATSSNLWSGKQGVKVRVFGHFGK